MRRALCMLTVFVAGLLVGVLVTSHVWIVASRGVHESMLSEYQLEQELLASRARRSGDTLGQALHALNVADVQAELGFRWLQRWRSDGYWDWFRLPWKLFPLIRDVELGPRPELESARRRIEAGYRAQAALALEPLGAAHAETQWKHATELMPAWSREQLRAAAEGWGRQSEDYESAWLDSRTRAELQLAIDGMSRPMGATPEEPAGYR